MEKVSLVNEVRFYLQKIFLITDLSVGALCLDAKASSPVKESTPPPESEEAVVNIPQSLAPMLLRTFPPTDNTILLQAFRAYNRHLTFRQDNNSSSSSN